MECSCGGDTEERQIVEQRVIVCRYQLCKYCGRQVVTSGDYPSEQNLQKEGSQGALLFV